MQSVISRRAGREREGGNSGSVEATASLDSTICENIIELLLQLYPKATRSPQQQYSPVVHGRGRERERACCFTRLTAQNRQTCCTRRQMLPGQVLAQLHLRSNLADPAGRLFSLCVANNYVQVRNIVVVLSVGRWLDVEIETNSYSGKMNAIPCFPSLDVCLVAFLTILGSCLQETKN